MLEGEIQQLIQLEARAHNVQLMRNNSGALEDKTGRLVRYGLGNVSKTHSDKIKSSDLIGFRTITVTPDMVGKKIAVFTAVEVKKPDWKLKFTSNLENDKRVKAQMAFIDWVYSNGGYSGFANSIESFKKIIGV